MEVLVQAILEAQGYETERAPKGADGGVGIVAGRGSLGFDGPHLIVQVKAWEGTADVEVYRSLRGAMRSFNASRALLVCWGGFTRAVYREARANWTDTRLWSQTELVQAIYEVYSKLPESIRAELPLKRIWTLVDDE